MSEQYRCTECGHFVEIRDDVICDVCHIGKMEHLRYIKGGNGSHWEGCEEVHWDCKIVHLEAELSRLTAELAELRERTRWIPVSERLPEDDYLVNVAFLYKNKIRTTSASHNNYGWYFDMEISGPTMLEDVTHWMPLPEPPEADDADN